MDLKKIAMILGYVWAVIWIVLGIVFYLIGGTQSAFILIAGVIMGLLVGGGAYFAGKWPMYGGILLIILSLLSFFGVFTIGWIALIGYILFGAPILASGILFIVNEKRQ